MIRVYSFFGYSKYFPIILLLPIILTQLFLDTENITKSRLNQSQENDSLFFYFGILEPKDVAITDMYSLLHPVIESPVRYTILYLLYFTYYWYSCWQLLTLWLLSSTTATASSNYSSRRRAGRKKPRRWSTSQKLLARSSRWIGRGQ